MKQVMAVDPQTLESEPLATFTLTGDTVTAEYHDESFRFEMQHFGICVMARNLRPADGRAFYDALDIAYRASSFVWVRTSPDGA